MTKFFEFWFEDNILHSKFLTEVKLDVELGKKMIETRHQISNYQFQYWCYDFTLVKEMPKEARDYANKYGQEFLYASAAIVKTKIQAFIINIYISLKNPKIRYNGHLLG